MEPSFTNALIHETSPYLLQHAHNPVHWVAWSTEVINKAKQENKLLLISIGYAACHWCHVMEKECFEDEEVAEVMNAHFISIKIDREERPDIDHIYMDALQIMTGSGGWPLNIIALPDGRPFWGATFVKKANWIGTLKQIIQLYNEQPHQIQTYAADMVRGIRAINKISFNSDYTDFSLEQLDNAVGRWSQSWDTFLGGSKHAPKFMMPVNLDFLLHYGLARKHEAVLNYVDVTLTRMAYGGIFDHLGGGFARYAVDIKWHVPHFEKMLYDNGQLLSLYAKAYAHTKNLRYKKVVQETVTFLKRELMAPNAAFYSSLDADSHNSEGTLEEGAYYVWKASELAELLGPNFAVFQDYYNVNDYGFWENENYVLIRDKSDYEIEQKYQLTTKALQEVIENCKTILLNARNKRKRPRLDDKVLTSWNGLVLKGLVDAARYLDEPSYLDLALKSASFIHKHLLKKDGGLYHNHKAGKSTINGYLEDYASVIEAFIALYELTFDLSWLTRAKALADYCIASFLDPENRMFWFTAREDSTVIRKTVETADNVIPASNSIMAKNLFRLGALFPLEDYKAISIQMLRNVQDNFEKYPQNYGNWLHLVLYKQLPFYEMAIIGKEYESYAREIRSHYLPNTLVAGTAKEEVLALFTDRYSTTETLIYVCQEGSCKLPVTTVEMALEGLKI